MVNGSVTVRSFIPAGGCRVIYACDTTPVPVNHRIATSTSIAHHSCAILDVNPPHEPSEPVATVPCERGFPTFFSANGIRPSVRAASSARRGRR